jgi:hypothetical protein
MRPDVILPTVYDIFGNVISDPVFHYVTKTNGVSTFNIKIPREHGHPIHRKIILNTTSDGKFLTEESSEFSGFEIINYLSGEYDEQDIRIVTFYAKKPPDVPPEGVSEKEYIIQCIDRFMDEKDYRRNMDIEADLRTHELRDDVTNMPIGEDQDDTDGEDDQMLGVAFVSPLPGNFIQIIPQNSDAPGNFCHPLVFQRKFQEKTPIEGPRFATRTRDRPPPQLERGGGSAS